MPTKKGKHAEVQNRRAMVADLLIACVPYRRIAQQMGVSVATIATDVKACFKRWAEEQRPEARFDWLAKELAKLDNVEFRINPLVASGGLEAARTLLKILERRARMLGLDAPEKLQAAVSIGDNSQYREMVQRMSSEQREKWYALLNETKEQADTEQETNTAGV